MKKIILASIISFLVGLSLTVGAVYLYNAKDIEFTSTNIDFKATNVEEAIEEIVDNYIELNPKEIKALKTNGASGGITSATIENVNDYKMYIVTTLYWSSSTSNVSSDKTNCTMTSATNSKFYLVGNSGRDAGTTSGAIKSYIVVPDGSGNNITLKFNKLDGYSIYGIN